MRDNIQGGALTETTFLILLALYTPRHGYGVLGWIEAATGGRVRLGAGTLYGALSALCGKGWIAPWGEATGGKRAYRITPAGERAAQGELGRLRDVERVAREVLEEGRA